MKISSLASGILALLAMFACGCSPTPPPVTLVEGVVLLDGKPLPNAQVQFIPNLEQFGAEMNSTATTDDHGRFELKCTYKAQPGAVVGKHWVLVIEPPVPAELRGVSEQAQLRMQDYLDKLVNRPIPEEYGTVGKTPLIIDVTKDRKTYELKLTRTR